ncbi:hypothetical protein Patl1_05717 [Pistacia atlantica]|uniref:Uncharacterized protein n=1 Tax=Pistacia atlantica TaxID=434234 RepID=A0ACC1BTC2_9ROSI|nr:hypothetical protein Patl1_05717 [Pistacia atlantica]
MSSFHMIVNLVFHRHTKNIELDYHYFREKVALGSLITRFLLSYLHIFDNLTKFLPRHVFLQFRFKFGLHSIPPSNLRPHDKEIKGYVHL